MTLPEREYVVTLKNFKDMDQFYLDMDQGIGDYVPKRSVEVTELRPSSRNTNYLLTSIEAEKLKNDPRILDIELSIAEQNLSLRPNWIESSNSYDKSDTADITYKNWGLLRSFNGYQTFGWGTDGGATNSGSIKTTASGKNVDIVVIDGHIDQAHPEFAVNPDGSGGSRLVQYNWYDLNPSVTGGSTDIYQYGPYFDGINDTVNDHGCLNASLIAGNKYGWARDANIYNINPYVVNSTYLIDYIRAWHVAKVSKNPTVVCNNFTISVTIPLQSIKKVKYQGKIYDNLLNTVTDGLATGWGIPNNTINATFPIRNTAIEQDLIDAMNQGVIVVGSAGNDGAKIGTVSASEFNDYNNYLELEDSTRYYYQRGTISAAVGVICVGAISALRNETRRIDSNCGPRVDIYAPGTNLQASSQLIDVDVNRQDTRNVNYSVKKISGTSASASLVAGVLACWAEVNRVGTTKTGFSFLSLNATYNQITDTKGGNFDNTDLHGSPNRMLTFVEPLPGGTVIDKQLLKDLTFTF